MRILSWTFCQGKKDCARLIAFVVVFAALSGCASGDRESDSTPRGTKELMEAAETQVTLGVDYLQKGRTELAMERFQRALKFNPRSANAHTSLGVLYEQISRPDLAEKSYARAAQLEPKKGAPRNNYGQFLCRVGRYDEANREFTAALDDPFYATPVTAAINAGKCAKLSGKPTDAERYLRIALERRPDAKEVFLPLAGVLAERGENMKARAFLQRHESSGLPMDADFLKLGIKVETKLGDLKAAQAYRERLENDYPNGQSAESNSSPQSETAQ
jgi:type IV pilus assembly protein PilF